MKKEIIASGKDVQEARANAALQLGATDMDNVVYETLALPKKGFLGLGAQPAKVKATMEIPDDTPKEPRHADRRRDGKPQGDRAPRRENNGGNRPPKRQKDAPVDTPREPAEPHEPMKTEAEIVLTPLTVNAGEDLSFDFVNGLLANLGINASASLFSQDEGGRRICIEGEDASILIGHHGETLDALQYLSNLACAKKNVNGERLRDHVTIDIEGYRAKREDTLRKLARRTADRVLRNKRNVTLEPMNAYERRIIHSEIQGIAGVSTNSIGTDNNRRVVVYLADKPQADTAVDAPAEADAPAEEENV